MSSVEILVPDLPESVADATVVTWHKKTGDDIHRDEILVEIETDKVILEVPAPESGILEIFAKEGAIVLSKQLLGRVSLIDDINVSKKITKNQKIISEISKCSEHKNEDLLSPSSRRLIAEYNLSKEDIKKIGIIGKLTREDIEKYLNNKDLVCKSEFLEQNTESTKSLLQSKEQRVVMTRLRKRISERMLEAKNTTAMLTTFNEVNMLPIKELRSKYGEMFEKRHGVRLGFMSFYVKAVIEALKRYPEVNASIDCDDIVYHNYFDISIAVSTSRGLVTPVLRKADSFSFVDIEKKIKELSIKARDSKLNIDDLNGGNFTITNGGIFGSLMSTPIINPPQSAILGMHSIKDRPMVVNNRIEILPMMYLALSYDHCLIDGRESVGFLIVIKEMIEDPIRLLLDV
ncbi:Dihydrolipoyllysine-residue succinyltransferase component of 2-oxoglutarate dehydrogenase complex [Candidatus Providencia siddallii]|uniref:Dihydrolipoyllysine-residue succinyltransferase n=1 Tax=Candidatus Providencia siddallii TaxID=1715285 RepID=A0A0M6W873_9GAMM|nr:Dihydrolipoyllysine-residue succinyltransferase component of 2-oxoglutarate dehydrogenase complex [Candidatus Providencia siddallii]